MKIRNSLLSAVILVTFICGALFLARHEPQRQTLSELPSQLVVESRAVIPVSVVDVTIESQGSVTPFTETTLIAEVSGRVTHLSPAFVAGDVFRKGDVLITLDSSDYEVQVQQAEAVMAAREAQLFEEQARSQAEEKNWLRSGRPLSKAPPLLLRKPYVEEAKANIKAARAELEKAHRYLAKTRILAPYDGMVRQSQANLGQYIAVGTPLGVIFDTTLVEVRLPIPASRLPLLDMPAFGATTSGPEVVLSARFGEKTVQWNGRIVRSEGVVEQSTRMPVLVARVYDPFGIDADKKNQLPLKPGLFVRAVMTGRPLNDVIALPRALIHRNSEVWVVNQGVMRLRQVTVVHNSDGVSYISTGFATGDRLITTALSDPIEGTPVTDSRGASVETEE